MEEKTFIRKTTAIAAALCASFSLPNLAQADPNALQQGLARISEVCGAGPGDRTMIDALGPALDVLPGSLASAAAAARKGADSTASILQAKAGRAAYVPAENLDGHNDPGAEAVALVFEGLSAKPAS